MLFQRWFSSWDFYFTVCWRRLYSLRRNKSRFGDLRMLLARSTLICSFQWKGVRGKMALPTSAFFLGRLGAGSTEELPLSLCRQPVAVSQRASCWTSLRQTWLLHAGVFAKKIFAKSFEREAALNANGLHFPRHAFPRFKRSCRWSEQIKRWQRSCHGRWKLGIILHHMFSNHLKTNERLEIQCPDDFWERSPLFGIEFLRRRKGQRISVNIYKQRYF